MGRAPGLGAAASRRPAALALVLAVGVVPDLSACALPVQAEMDRASSLAHYAAQFDHVVGADHNMLDQALANCGEKTVSAESACVRRGLDAAALPVRALVAMVPNCKIGQICHYEHTTRDRLGFIEANATDYVKRWRIDLDLRKPAADTAYVPATVIDRDDFGAPG